MRSAAQEVVPNEPVEVVRRSQADVGLHVSHTRIVEHRSSEVRGHACRLFKGGALRQIHHYLKLALVVERQHLDRHELQRHQHDRREQQHSHTARKITRARALAMSLPITRR